jgi:hypothetical protein
VCCYLSIRIVLCFEMDAVVVICMVADVVNGVSKRKDGRELKGRSWHDGLGGRSEGASGDGPVHLA